MRPFVTVVLFTFFLVPQAFSAKHKKWNVPCEKVFVTGAQTHEIAWALRGAGLKNNLYRHTCQEPVAKASEAAAILDLEFNPDFSPANLSKEQDERLDSPSYFVSCSTNGNGSFCSDSDGNILVTNCSDSGCSSYYGPNPISTALDLVNAALTAHFARTSAWAYLFSAKHHRLLWKYAGIKGTTIFTWKSATWHDNLDWFSECPERYHWPAGHPGACKPPTSLLK